MPMMAPRAILIDFDGTLVDTGAANYESYAAALSEVGVTVDRSTFDRHVSGRSWREFLPRLLEEAGVVADCQSIAQRKRVLYGEKVAHLRINHGIVGLLCAARNTLRAGLVTTASRGSVEAILEHHALTTLFDVVITGDDVIRPKPDPEAYLLAAKRLSVAPDECLVFEDSEVGVASAHAAGMTVVRVVFP